MSKIILALDTTDVNKALEITKKIKDKIFTIKIGLEMWNSFGKDGVKPVKDFLAQQSEDKVEAPVEKEEEIVEEEEEVVEEEADEASD